MSAPVPKPVIRLVGLQDADLQHCRLLFEDYHRFDLVARRAVMPAASTARRSGKSKMPRTAEEPPAQIQPILDSAGGGDIPKLVAPYLVWRVKPYTEEFHILGWEPHPAAVFRVMCKDWRVAIDQEIKLWTVEFNRLFKKTLFPLYALQRSWGRGTAGMEPPNLTIYDETIADETERAQRKLQIGRRWFEAKLMVEEFKEHAELNIHPDQFQRMIKEMPNIWDGKITVSAMPGELTPTMMPEFFVNTESPCFYFSVGGQEPQCQICGPLGKKCASVCTPVFHHLPGIHGERQVVMCGPKCLKQLTIRFDSRASEPLDTYQDEDVRKLELPDFKGATFEQREPRSTLPLFKCMLRRKGVVAPFYNAQIRRLAGGDAFDAFFRYGAPEEQSRPRRGYGDAAPGAEEYMRPRAPPPEVIVLDHMGIQKNSLGKAQSLQSMLGIGPYEMKLALADYEHERAVREDTWKYEMQRRCEKMEKDFISMATQGVSDDEGTLSIADLDSWFPGVKATIECALRAARFDCKVTHILDIPSGNEICEAVRFMIGALARQDDMLSDSRAHGHAYSWYTGTYLARVPDTTLRDIGRRLNIDLALADRDGGASVDLWEAAVAGLHAFSAIDWQHMGVRAKKDGGGAASSSSAAFIGRFEWYVNIGGTEVTGNYTPALTRESYVKMRKSAKSLLTTMGWSVAWPGHPTVQDVSSMRAFAEGSSHDRELPTEVMDYVTVIAKQLCCFKDSRGYGIDVLTGFDSRGFCAAVYNAQLRGRELAVMVDAMPQKEEPDDEEGEEGEQGEQGEQA